MVDLARRGDRDDPGARLGRRAVLHGCVAGAASPPGEHAHADRARHLGGLAVLDGRGGRTSIFPKASFAEVYYDVSAVVVALVTLGMALEVKAKGRSSEAIRKLVGLQAKTARVIRDGQELDVPVEQVLVGDVLAVRPGREGAGRRRDRRRRVEPRRVDGHRRVAAGRQGRRAMR